MLYATICGEANMQQAVRSLIKIECSNITMTDVLPILDTGTETQIILQCNYKCNYTIYIYPHTGIHAERIRTIIKILQKNLLTDTWICLYNITLPPPQL